MNVSGLTGIITIGVTAGLGQHHVEVSLSEAKLIGVVSLIFLNRTGG